MLKIIMVMGVLILLFTGCSTEYADDDAQQMNTLSDADNPELAIGRDMLATALMFDIDRFVERNRPELKVCFLSILDADPADDLLARLEGAKLEVYKFSEWTTYFKDENGAPYIPERFFRISVRDVRLIDSTHFEVDTQWSASGIYIPGETFVVVVDEISGSWVVIEAKVTPPK